MIALKSTYALYTSLYEQETDLKRVIYTQRIISYIKYPVLPGGKIEAKKLRVRK